MILEQKRRELEESKRREEEEEKRIQEEKRMRREIELISAAAQVKLLTGSQILQMEDKEESEDFFDLFDFRFF